MFNSGLDVDPRVKELLERHRRDVRLLQISIKMEQLQSQLQSTQELLDILEAQKRSLTHEKDPVNVPGLALVMPPVTAPQLLLEKSAMVVQADPGWIPTEVPLSSVHLGGQQAMGELPKSQKMTNVLDTTTQPSSSGLRQTALQLNASLQLSGALQLAGTLEREVDESPSGRRESPRIEVCN